MSDYVDLEPDWSARRVLMRRLDGDVRRELLTFAAWPRRTVLRWSRNCEESAPPQPWDSMPEGVPGLGEAPDRVVRLALRRAGVKVTLHAIKAARARRGIRAFRGTG